MTHIIWTRLNIFNEQSCSVTLDLTDQNIYKFILDGFAVIYERHPARYF